MEKGSVIGIVLVIVGTFVGSTMKGVSPMQFFSVPAALLIVLVASLGATMLSNTFVDTKDFIRYMKKAFAPGPAPDPTAVIGQVVEFADRARREGLLALEDSVGTAEDPFLQKGLQMAIDGADPEIVRDTLETEVQAMKERHKVGSAFMTTMGIFCPTFGIIGAVIGLIATLSNLADPAKLGSGIAAAFVATFWGVFAANGVFLPLGKKLARLSEEEVAYRELIVEGVLSIQSGSSPRVIDDLLQSFLPPRLRVQMRAKKEEERESA